MIRTVLLALALCWVSASTGMAQDCGADQSGPDGMDRVYCKPEGRPFWGQALEAFGIRNFQKSYALVIGISEFDGYAALPTKSDPIRMQEFLINEAGFDYVHVLTDKAATLERVRELMVGTFPDVMGDADRFLFYWSGHGVTRDTPRGQNGYLPVAATENDRYPQMISMREFEAWNDLIPARQVLFLLDSCFSGLAGVSRKSDLQDLTLQQLSGPARHILTAGTAGEETIAIDRLNGSVFTAAVIDGLRGAAEADNALGRDGLISINELQNYVTQRVALERTKARWPKPITPQLRDLGINEGAFFFRVPGASVPGGDTGGDTGGGAGGGTGGGAVADGATISAEDIRFIQENLPTLGYPAGAVTGKLNMATQLALIRFQTELGLSATGKPDAATQLAMLQALADPTRATGVTGQGGGNPVVDAGGDTDNDPDVLPGPSGSLCAECPEFKRIPATTFQMGYDQGRPDFGPAVSVKLPAFDMAVTEVTKAQYAAFAEEFGLDFVNAKTEQKASCYEWTADKKRLKKTGFAYGQLLGDQNEPVACVSFKDAIAYIEWLNSKVPGTPFRLPTEAEYAAVLRAGLPNEAHKYNGADDTSGFPWRETEILDNHPGIAPVASYDPDRFGLYDMRGNLWEWTADCWTERLDPEQINQGYTGPCADGAAVLKGGSFDDPFDNFHSYVRQPAPLSRRQENIGFRIARDAG